MPAARKRPCSICRRWFRPDPRVGLRQHTCGKPDCQAARRKKTQARWRTKNPDYAAGYRLQRRNSQERVPEPLRVPAPLNRLPGLRTAPLRHAGSRTTLCRLAGRFAVGARAPARLSGAVFQNAAASAAGGDNALGRTRARSGNGRGPSAACPPPAARSITGDGPGATA